MAIPLPCATTFTKPLQKNNVPIVATIEGIPIFVTKSPLINPANIPSDMLAKKAKKKFPSVPVNTMPKAKDEIPTIDGKDKSISPRVITKVAEIAMIPKKGIDCMNAR